MNLPATPVPSRRALMSVGAVASGGKARGKIAPLAASRNDD
jgi:hypothetical protein